MSKQTVRTPQRIIKLTRYLESVLTNEKAPDRLRMQAAERLCELFLETERGKRERAVAALRADARVELARLEKTAQGTAQTDESLKQAAEAQEQATAVDSKAEMQAYLSQFVK